MQTHYYLRTEIALPHRDGLKILPRGKIVSSDSVWSLAFATSAAEASAGTELRHFPIALVETDESRDCVVPTSLLAQMSTRAIEAHGPCSFHIAQEQITHASERGFRLADTIRLIEVGPGRVVEVPRTVMEADIGVENFHCTVECWDNFRPFGLPDLIFQNDNGRWKFLLPSMT